MRTEWLAGLIVGGLLLTAAGVIATGQWRLAGEMREWREQAKAVDDYQIVLKERELCVLWLSGEQRVAFRGSAQVDTVERPTWSSLCDWMKGISP